MFLAGLKEVEDDLDTLNGGGSIKGASGNFIGQIYDNNSLSGLPSYNYATVNDIKNGNDLEE